MSTYNKPHLSFLEQLQLLKTRGLEITDNAVALSCLERIGYYRLSAYWYPLRKIPTTINQNIKKTKPHREDAFHDGSNFKHVFDLYVFDKRLRLLILDAIERIEVALRVDIAYLLGSKDRFAHTNPSMLHGNFAKHIQKKQEKQNMRLGWKNMSVC